MWYEYIQLSQMQTSKVTADACPHADVCHLQATKEVVQQCYNSAALPSVSVGGNMICLHQQVIAAVMEDEKIPVAENLLQVDHERVS